MTVRPQPGNERIHAFRVQTALPLILEESFPDDTTARFKIVDFWGVKIDPSRVDDARVSVILLKFVRATYVLGRSISARRTLHLIMAGHRDFDVQKAIERFGATVKWREEFNIAGLLDEKFDESIYGGVGHVFGRDKEGRPITYVLTSQCNLFPVLISRSVQVQHLRRGCRHPSSICRLRHLCEVCIPFSYMQTCVQLACHRWRVQLQEKAMRLLDFETADSLVQVRVSFSLRPEDLFT